MGYSAGEGGSNPSFDFFGRRDPDQAAIMEKRKKDTMATDSPFEVGGDSQQESPLLAALRSAPQRNLRGGGGGRADYGDPRRGQGLGPTGWQGGYGRNSGGGQQQFYGPSGGYPGQQDGEQDEIQRKLRGLFRGGSQGPRQGQGLALGSGGTGYNPNAPNPNATRGGWQV